MQYLEHLLYKDYSAFSLPGKLTLKKCMQLKIAILQCLVRLKINILTATRSTWF